MPILAPGQTVRQKEPTLLVENPLEAGAWRFTLTVVGEFRDESPPTELIVNVVRPIRPPIRDAELIRETIIRRPTPFDPRRINPR